MGLSERDYMRDRNKERSKAQYRASVSNNRWGQYKTALVVIGAVALMYYLAKNFLDSKVDVPFPTTGEVLWYVPVQEKQGAPLTISAPVDGTRNFAVRLTDWANGGLVAIVPVRGGETAQLQVPLGQYQITIASGKRWQGPERMFGMTGELRKAVAPLHFYKVGNQTHGQRIDLAGRLDGNLETRPAGFFDK